MEFLPGDKRGPKGPRFVFSTNLLTLYPPRPVAQYPDDMRSTIYRWFRDTSIAKKLYFTVGIMALLIAIELFVLFFSINTLSSVRAYVGGEGLWSQAQKRGLYH